MYTIGLDIGSMYIKGVLIEITEDKKNKVISVASCKYKGVKSGTIIDLEETRNSISKVLKTINENNFIISNYFVNVSGKSVSGYYGQAQIPLWKKDGDDKRVKVTKKHYSEVIETAKVSCLGEKRKILHSFPQKFQIDDQPITLNPIDMSGIKISSSVYVIQAEKNHLENINTILNDCNVKEYQLIYSPIATSESILEEEDKESGVIVINLGAQTTELVIYKEGVLVKSSVIPLGSDFVTKDLQYVLRVDYNAAESIKLHDGNAFLGDLSEDDFIDIHSSSIVEDGSIKVRHISEIITARLKEIYEFVVKEIYENGYNKSISTTIVTGGGMKLKGAKKLFEQFTNTKIINPTLTGIEMNSDIDEVFYYTALGLVKYAINNNLLNVNKKNNDEVIDEDEKTGWKKFIGFLKDLI